MWLYEFQLPGSSSPDLFCCVLSRNRAWQSGEGMVDVWETFPHWSTHPLSLHLQPKFSLWFPAISLVEAADTFISRAHHSSLHQAPSKKLCSFLVQWLPPEELKKQILLPSHRRDLRKSLLVRSLQNHCKLNQRGLRGLGVVSAGIKRTKMFS